MKQDDWKQAVIDYLDALDIYHTRFATHRLLGWNGNQPAPVEVSAAHAAMLTKLETMYLAVCCQPRPNYVNLARQKMPRIQIVQGIKKNLDS